MGGAVEWCDHCQYTHTLYRSCRNRDPKHLGVEIGFFSVLHSWGRSLHFHPHLHGVVPGGGLSPDHHQWIPGRRRFLLPGQVLSRRFRRLFLEALEAAYEAHGFITFAASRLLFFHASFFELRN